MKNGNPNAAGWEILKHLGDESTKSTAWLTTARMPCWPCVVAKNKGKLLLNRPRTGTPETRIIEGRYVHELLGGNAVNGSGHANIGQWIS